MSVDVVLAALAGGRSDAGFIRTPDIYLGAVDFNILPAFLRAYREGFFLIEIGTYNIPLRILTFEIIFLASVLCSFSFNISTCINQTAIDVILIDEWLVNPVGVLYDFNLLLSNGQVQPIILRTGQLILCKGNVLVVIVKGVIGLAIYNFADAISALKRPLRTVIGILRHALAVHAVERDLPAGDRCARRCLAVLERVLRAVAVLVLSS